MSGDVVRRGAPVELDRERRVRYTLRAVAEIQEKFDVDIVSGERLPFNRIEDIAWLVWIGLREAGERPDSPWWRRLLVAIGVLDPPELPLDEVAGWIDMQNITDVATALQEAMGQEAVEPEDLQPESPDPTRAGAAEAEAVPTG